MSDAPPAAWLALATIGGAVITAIVNQGFGAFNAARDRVTKAKTDANESTHKLVADLQNDRAFMSDKIDRLEARVESQNLKLDEQGVKIDALKAAIEKHQDGEARAERRAQGLEQQVAERDSKIAELVRDAMRRRDEADAYALLYDFARKGKVPDAVILQSIEKALVNSGQISAGDVNKVIEAS